MNRFLSILLLLASCVATSAQTPVKQSGTVTPAHAACWTTNGIVQDCGTAAIPFLNTLGTVYPGDSICAWSALSTSGAAQKICLGANTSTGTDITVQNFGTASPKNLTLNLNGTTYQFPFSTSGVIGPNPTVVGDVATWNNAVGTLLGDSTSIASGQNFYFGSGRPWVDVRSGTNGCAAAAGNGSTDDTAAIQCQINYLNTNFGGGIVNVPLGTYLVSGGGITIKGGVQVIGAGAADTVIEALTDSTVVTFDASTCNKYAALNNIFITGYQNVAATQSTVTIGANCPVIMRDDYVWFGLNGINNGGVDSLIENVYVCAYGDAIKSTGANWYIRVKADTCAITSTNAFEQLGSTTLENHIIQSDFSGNYTNSLRINNSASVMSISQSVFGANIAVVSANFTQIDSSEIAGGITISGSGNMTFNNNVVLTGTVTPSGGLYNCAGNVNLICPMFSQSSVIIGATGTNCSLVSGDQLWHTGTNQNGAITVKQNLATGIALQSLNDACNALEGWEIEATNVQVSQGPLSVGLSGSVVGQVVYYNATGGGGSITDTVPTGALGSSINTKQAVTDTYVYRATPDTLTNKNISTTGAGANTITGTNASVNTFLRGDGSWTAGTGAMTYLCTIIASNSASINNASPTSGSCPINGTYTSYVLIFQNIVPATNEKILELQIHSGGAYKSTSYLTSGIWTAITGNGSQTPTTYIPISYPADSNAIGLQNAAPGLSGKYIITNPSASAIIMIYGEMAYFNGGGSITIGQSSGYWNSAAAVDGFQVLMDSGNITSGSILVYGVQ